MGPGQGELENLSANVAEKTSKSKLTALFTVRRWLREIPCSAAQAQVLFALASFARPDGTGVHPGQNGLEAITKLDRRTIGRAIKDWRTVGAVTRTQGGNRRLKQADEYKINLDWQPSNATVGHFCKSGSESHLKNSFGTSESSFGTLGSSNATPDRPIEESSSSKKHFIENARAHSSARKTAAPQSGLATRPELRARAPENNSARNWVRNPAHGAGNKIIQALATAGERGVSSVELAAHLYGDSENRARDRVVQIVAGLRKKGFSILLTGSDPFARRYVLRKN